MKDREVFKGFLFKFNNLQQNMWFRYLNAWDDTTSLDEGLKYENKISQCHVFRVNSYDMEY